MINSTLEADLRLYCKTIDGNLFQEKLYQSFKYMAAYICKKREVSTNDIEDMITDMVSHAAITIPVYYNESKGTAKAALYILLNQYLLQKINHGKQQKRDRKKLIFIEDIENFDGYTASVIEIEVDLFTFNKHTLKEKQQLFKKLNDKLHNKVVDKIIQAIQEPSKFKQTKFSYVNDIAKKCNTRKTKVYETIKYMHAIVEEHGLNKL